MDYVYLWAVVFFVGLAAIFAALKGKSIGGLNTTVVGAIGVGATLAGFFLGFGPLIGYDVGTEPSTGPITVIDEAIGAPAFDLTPSNGSYNWATDPGSLAGTVSSDETQITFPVTVTNGNMFTMNGSAVNFSIVPVPPEGADSQDLATIYFGVDETLKYDGEPIFKESGGVWRAKWLINDGGTQENYEGSHTMLMTDNHWVAFTCIFDGGGTDTFGEEFDVIGDTTTIPIDFWNADHSWSETFDMILVCIDAA